MLARLFKYVEFVLVCISCTYRHASDVILKSWTGDSDFWTANSFITACF